MKLKELLNKIPDHYIKLSINEHDGSTRTGRVYLIGEHKISQLDEHNIPDEIFDEEVTMIIPYYDWISVQVQRKHNDIKKLFAGHDKVYESVVVDWGKPEGGELW